MTTIAPINTDALGNHNERAHAKFSASGAHRWMGCPGSYREEAKYPPKPAGKAALWGTECHEWAEKILDAYSAVIAGGNDGADVYAYESIQAEYAQIEADRIAAGDTDAEGLLATANAYVDYVITFWEQVGYDAKLLIEHRFDMNWVLAGVPEFAPRDEEGNILEGQDPTDVMFGTNDAILISDEYLDIFDLKGGAGILVEAEDNVQLKYYALGAHHDFGYLYGYKKVRLHIIQPRKDNFDCFELTVEELEQFEEELRNAAVATQDPDAPIIPGEKQCTFCRAKIFCPAKIADAERAAVIDFEDAKDFMNLDDLYELACRVEPWAKAVKAHVKTEMLNGAQVAGMKVVAGRSTRAYRDPAEAEQELKTLVPDSVVPELFTEPKLKSVAQVEKVLKTVLPAKEVKDVMAKVADKIPGKPTIAKDSDRRAALDVTTLAQSDFTAEDDESPDDD